MSCFERHSLVMDRSSASAMPFDIAAWHDTILPLRRWEHSLLHPHSQRDNVGQAARFKCWCFDESIKLKLIVQLSEVLPSAQILPFSPEPAGRWLGATAEDRIAAFVLGKNPWAAPKFCILCIQYQWASFVPRFVSLPLVRPLKHVQP